MCFGSPVGPTGLALLSTCWGIREIGVDHEDGARALEAPKPVERSADAVEIGAGASHAHSGMIVPLFITPFGSKACFSVSRMEYEEPYSSFTQGALAFPIPW